MKIVLINAKAVSAPYVKQVAEKATDTATPTWGLDVEITYGPEGQPAMSKTDVVFFPLDENDTLKDVRDNKLPAFAASYVNDKFPTTA